MYDNVVNESWKNFLSAASIPFRARPNQSQRQARSPRPPLWLSNGRPRPSVHKNELEGTF